MEALALSAGESDPQAAAAYLVVVHKGPTWNVEDLAPYCRLLSRRFTGEVWAFGSYDADTVIGRIRLRVVGTQPFRDRTNLRRFLRRALRWTEELRAACHPRLALISLEPFVSGLLGLYAARRARGALICEVNGVYGSRHNTADTRAALVRNIRVTLRRMVGAYVLRHATAVRLLFTDQLRGFVALPERVIRRQFFEITNWAAFRPGPEEPVILGVGFPFRVKGFDILCQAFVQVSRNHPAWKLVLIGHRVPEEVLQGGFNHPRIEAYPGMTQQAVAEWMARCAIFALPSRTEAMGRVLLEAGAASKCRVAARVDGIPAVVQDGADGVLVEPENPESLASALERLISDSSLRSDLGNAARRRIESEFSEELYLDHYSELVAAALNRAEP